MKSELSLGVLFTGKLDASFSSVINQIKGALGQLQGSIQKVTQAQNQQRSSMLNLQGGLKSYLSDVQKLLQIQARWYGAKMVLFSAVELPVDVLRKGLAFLTEIDSAEAKIRRYDAMMGDLTETSRRASHELVLLARQLNLQYAPPFDEIIKSADRLRAAGTDLEVILSGVLEDFVKFQTAWPETEMNSFTKAVVGIINTYKDTPIFKQMGDETQMFKNVLDKLTVALGVGVVEPRDLPRMMQHFGQMSQAAGLTVDEMLALDVLVTNLGKSAGTAARSLRGMVSSLVQPDKIKLFEQIGIQIDRTLPIGKQLISVMTQLKTLVTGSGEAGISTGAASILGQLTSTERIDAFIAIIREMKDYQEILEMIQNSSGANDRASKEMNMTLSTQWKLFKELIKEIGMATSSSETLGIALYVLKLIVQGLGLATFAVTEAFGRFIYFMGVGALTVVALGKAIKNLSFEPFRELHDWINKRWDTMNQKFWETRSLLLGEQMKFGGLAKDVLKQYGDIPDILTPDALKKKKNINASLIASERAVRNSLLAIQKGADDVALKLLDNSHKLGLISDEDYYQKKLSYLEKAIVREKEILKNEQAIIDAQHDQAIKEAEDEDTKKKEAAAKRADYYKYLTKLKEIDFKRDVEIDNAVTERQLSHIDRLKALSNHYYAIKEISRKRDLEREQASIEEREAVNNWAISQGMKSQEDYYNEQIRLIERNSEAEIDAVNKALKGYLDQNSSMIQFAKGEERGKLIREREERIAQTEADIERVKFDTRKAYLDANLQNIIAYYTQYQNEVESFYQGEAIEREATFATQQFKTDEAIAENEWLYSQKYKTAKEFYTTERRLINEQYENRKKLLEQEYINDQNANAAKRRGLDEESAEFINLYAEWVNRRKKFNADMQEEDRNYLSAVQEHLLSVQASFEMIYSAQGIGGVVKRSLDMLLYEYSLYGQRWKSYTEELASGMEQSFQSLFVDAMKVQLKSVSDYFQLFANSIIQTVARMLSQEVMKEFIALIGRGVGFALAGGMNTGRPAWVGAGGTTAFGMHTGGIAGLDGSPRNVPSWLFNLAPRLHSGLSSDEFPAILQKGETVIPKGMSATPALQVNIENQTGTPVEAKDVTAKFDLEKFVVNVVLKNVAQNGPLRKLVTQGS